MNKPAPKEPSMDEILSSIRQIIADDDAAGIPRRSSIQPAPAPMQATPVRTYGGPMAVDLDDHLEDPEPLALSPAQIVAQGSGEAETPFSFEAILADTQAANQDDDNGEDALVTAPEPMGFEPEEPAAPVAQTRAPDPEPVRIPEPRFAEPVRVPEAPRPQATISQAAPLPDPTLSSDFAEELLGPATKAAVRSSITKLNGIGLGNAGLTIEALMRDMLRPMLKEWLDENLPAVVERMVEREIARVSRGE
ncbi:MAG: hypothetical protein JWR39_234 [Devosia sp.]|jgi:cell pole-organizing protein PopZ|nr:hypothetical protein [Devosia sp.]